MRCAVFFVLLSVSAGLSAKDLYVAVTGDDSVSYADNGINTPWRTVQHGVYNLREGDTLFIREGTYVPQYPLKVRRDYDRANYGGDPNETVYSESGTEANPVKITSYPGETVTIDCQNVEIWLDLDGKSYWEIADLHFINAQNVVRIGYNSSAQHNIVRNNRIVMNRGGDNFAALLTMGLGRGEYSVFDGNEITGPGTGSNVHHNTGTIFFRNVQNLKIINNRLANAPIGIHSKHSNPGPSASVDIEIAYNYITDTGRDSILLNANYAYIHDNILGPRNASVRIAAANGNAGGDFNVIEHNTFFDTGVTLSIESGGSTDQAPGAYGNALLNNIFSGSSSVEDASSNSTTLDYNLYPAGTSLSGLGESSIAGDPIFVNGDNPQSVDDYQLAPSSPGAGQSSTGTDMGARIDRFGQLVTGLIRPRSPTSLLIIQ